MGIGGDEVSKKEHWGWRGWSKVPYMAVVHVLFPATSEGPTNVGLLVGQHNSSVPPS